MNRVPYLPQHQGYVSGAVGEPKSGAVLRMRGYRRISDAVVARIQTKHRMQTLSQFSRNTHSSAVSGIRANLLHQGGHTAIAGVYPKIPVAHAGIAIGNDA